MVILVYGMLACYFLLPTSILFNRLQFFGLNTVNIYIYFIAFYIYVTICLLINDFYFCTILTEKYQSTV